MSLQNYSPKCRLTRPPLEMRDLRRCCCPDGEALTADAYGITPCASTSSNGADRLSLPLFLRMQPWRQGGQQQAQAQTRRHRLRAGSSVTLGDGASGTGAADPFAPCPSTTSAAAAAVASTSILSPRSNASSAGPSMLSPMARDVSGQCRYRHRAPPECTLSEDPGPLSPVSSPSRPAAARPGGGGSSNGGGAPPARSASTWSEGSGDGGCGGGGGVFPPRTASVLLDLPHMKRAALAALGGGDACDNDRGGRGSDGGGGGLAVGLGVYERNTMDAPGDDQFGAYKVCATWCVRGVCGLARAWYRVLAV